MTSKIMHHLEDLGSGKEGVVSLVQWRGKQCVCKQFKRTKSENKIKQEADLQMKAAEHHLAPKVLFVDLKKKQILMEFVPFSLVELCRETQHGELTDDQRLQLQTIMDKLDSIGILHNDGNALNLRVDYDGIVYLLDYGMSKKITPKIKSKWGQSPNTALTLFMMKRSLRHHSIAHGL